MTIRPVAGMLVAAAMLAEPLSNAVAAQRVPQICASRIYDFLKQPVTSFAIVSERSDLVSDDEYARYSGELTAAAAPLGYDPSATKFTLHEELSSFPFLNYGRVFSLVLVLCASGGEKANDCRRGEYYVDDRQLDPDRLSLILSDILTEPVPAPVDSCDFGLGDWPAAQ